MIRVRSTLSTSAAQRTFDAHLAEPEMRLLAACCRAAARPGPEAEAEIEAALRAPFDEKLLRKRCAVHRMTLLANRFLVRAHPHRFSPEAVAHFENHHRQQIPAHARLSAAAARLRDALGEAGIAHAFLKGPVLARQIFGADLLRAARDLDVIIARRDFARADAALARIGFHPRVSAWRAALRLPRHWSYRKDVNYEGPHGERLELHWRTDLVEVLLRDFGATPVASTEFQGKPTRVLPDMLNAVYLCLHGAKSHWSEFRWALDIPLFLKVRGIDPAEVLAAADALKLGTPVREAFYLGERLMGIPAPEGGRLDARGAARLARRYGLTHLPDRDKMETLALVIERSRLYPRPGSRLRFFAMSAMDKVLLLAGHVPNAVLLERKSRP